MAFQTICSVAECGKSHYGLSYCRRHYWRFKKHGSPTEGKAMRGAPVQWIFDNSTYEGENCLAWPFGAKDKGYGVANLDGIPMGAHRAMCIVAHGPAPEGRNCAAHSCGNGHLGCVNQKHLRWASHGENAIDAKEHGVLKGEKSGRALLTEKQVREIRRLHGSMSMKKIGVLYGVTGEAVASILYRRTWAWLPD